MPAWRSQGVGLEAFAADSGQFLWDFIAYQPGQGILLAAESEHDNKKREMAQDFEKLLYVRSPVKLIASVQRDESEFLHRQGNLSEPLVVKKGRILVSDALQLFALVSGVGKAEHGGSDGCEVVIFLKQHPDGEFHLRHDLAIFIKKHIEALTREVPRPQSS